MRAECQSRVTDSECGTERLGAAEVLESFAQEDLDGGTDHSKVRAA